MQSWKAQVILIEWTWVWMKMSTALKCTSHTLQKLWKSKILNEWEDMFCLQWVSTVLSNFVPFAVTRTNLQLFPSLWAHYLLRRKLCMVKFWPNIWQILRILLLSHLIFVTGANVSATLSMNAHGAKFISLLRHWTVRYEEDTCPCCYYSLLHYIRIYESCHSFLPGNGYYWNTEPHCLYGIFEKIWEHHLRPSSHWSASPGMFVETFCSLMVPKFCCIHKF